MKRYLSLNEKLSLKKTMLGTWCEIPSPEFINILAKAGMDFVIIDMEHGAMDYEQAGKMTMAAQVDGCSTIIRVPENSQSAILRALEIGADGVIVPHIETAKERKKVVEAIKFPPEGNRSLNPYTRAGGYHSQPDFTKKANKETVAAILVESLKGIENIKSIVNDKNLDIIYMGSYDISVALGFPGDTKNPKVVQTLKDLTTVILKHKKVASCLFHNQDDLRLLKKIGVNVLCYKVDTGIVYDEVKRVKKLL